MRNLRSIALRGRHAAGRRKVAGVSLIEVSIASVMFVGMGYVLSLSMRASERSHDTVQSVATGNEEVRATTVSLRDELRSARASSISVAEYGGFAHLRFQVPVEGTGPEPAWGAFERELDHDEAACHREGWWIEYTADATAGEHPPLVRRVVDANGEIRHTETLASRVSRFRVTEAGEVWVVEWTAETSEGKRDEEFDVRTRGRD